MAEGQLEDGCGEAQGQERAPDAAGGEKAPAEPRSCEPRAAQGHGSQQQAAGPTEAHLGGPQAAGGGRPARAESALACRPPPRQTGPPGRSTWWVQGGVHHSQALDQQVSCQRGQTEWQEEGEGQHPGGRPEKPRITNSCGAVQLDVGQWLVSGPGGGWTRSLERSVRASASPWPGTPRPAFPGPPVASPPATLPRASALSPQSSIFYPSSPAAQHLSGTEMFGATAHSPFQPPVPRAFQGPRCLRHACPPP